MFYIFDNNFYNNLQKPSFEPPKWVFRYIWTVLFLLMLASFIIIMMNPASTSKYAAVAVFFLQLALNLYWTKVFFGEHKIKKALIVATTLTVLVFIMIILFLRLSFLAGLLQFPYLFWLLFACFLNKIILDLNK